MNIITMRLADMVKPEKNVRIHTEQQLREFERSVRMFGQIRPIVVDENNVILAGNGLYETLLRMGYEEAQVYQYNDLTENQKKKLMIADNKIFSLGIENLDTLNSFLEDLQDDLDIPGFDSDILKQMVSDADEITEKLSEYGTLDDSEIRTIKEQNRRKSEPETDKTPTLDYSSSEQDKISSNIVKEEQDNDTAEVRKFVICTEVCGKRYGSLKRVCGQILM